MGEKTNALLALISKARQGTPDDRERIEIATAAFVHGMQVRLENTKKTQTTQAPHTAPLAQKATAKIGGHERRAVWRSMSRLPQQPEHGRRRRISSKKIRESQVAEFAEIHVEVKGVTSHDGISNTASNRIDAIYRKHFHPNTPREDV